MARQEFTISGQTVSVEETPENELILAELRLGLGQGWAQEAFSLALIAMLSGSGVERTVLGNGRVMYTFSLGPARAEDDETVSLSQL